VIKRGILGLILIVVSLTTYFLFIHDRSDSGDFIIDSREISGRAGQKIIDRNFALFFPADISEKPFAVSVKTLEKLPEIFENSKQKEAYHQIKLISQIYEITTSQALSQKPFYLSLNFTPELRKKIGKDDDVYLFTIENNMLNALEIVDSDLYGNYVTAKVHHNSPFYLGAIRPEIAILVMTYGLIYNAAKNFKGYLNPWQFLEPDNSDIKQFIARNSLEIPKNPSKEHFPIKLPFRFMSREKFSGLNQKFGTYARTASDIIKDEGKETEVLCHDMGNLYASLLYNMDSKLKDRIMVVNGTCDGTRHIWVEVALNGRSYVVDTTLEGSDAEMFFWEREDAYKDIGLKADQMYTAFSLSLQPYDYQWDIAFLDQDYFYCRQISHLNEEYANLQKKLEIISNMANSDWVNTPINNANKTSMQIIMGNPENIRKRQKDISREILYAKLMVASIFKKPIPDTYMNEATRQAIRNKRNYLVDLEKNINMAEETCRKSIVEFKKRKNGLIEGLNTAKARAASEGAEFNENYIAFTYTGGFANVRSLMQSIKECDNGIKRIGKNLNDGLCGHSYVGGYTNVKAMKESITTTLAEIALLSKNSLPEYGSKEFVQLRKSLKSMALCSEN